MSIGANITKYRKQKNLTQAELGEKIGVSNQAVSKWESGSTLPDVMLLPQIAEVLGVSLYDLYNLPDPKTSSPSASLAEIPEDRRTLVIHVIGEGVDVTTRFPVAAIRSALGNAILRDALAGTGVETENWLGMLDGGMTGQLLDADMDDYHVTIVVETYEN